MQTSRKDLLMGLMHSAEQGKKLREGTEYASKMLNEVELEPTKRNQSGGNFIYDRENPNANLRGQMNPAEVHNRERKVKGEVVQPAGENPINKRAQEEQRRRENSEVEMRRRSAPDAAINREPVMPSEVKNEAYENRLKVILETVRNIMEIGEIPPMTVSPKTAATKVKGKREIDTTGVAQGDRSSTGLGMNTTRPSSGGVSSRTAGVAQGERSSTGLGMNTTFSGY